MSVRGVAARWSTSRSADDGRLDVYVGSSPHRLSHWLRTFLRLITRRRVPIIASTNGATQVEVRLRHPDPYQLDGDAIGDCRTLRGSGPSCTDSLRPRLRYLRM